jgi:hypothetical protein
MKTFLINLSIIGFILNIIDFMLGEIITKNTSTYDERMTLWSEFYFNVITPHDMNILLLITSIFSIIILVPNIKRNTLLKEKIYASMTIIFALSAFIRLFWWFIAGDLITYFYK